MIYQTCVVLYGLVDFVQYQTGLHDFTIPVKTGRLVGSICSYRIADFVEHRSASEKISRLVDLYKALWSLYNIKQPCRNHRTSAPYTLSTILTDTLSDIYRLWRISEDVSTL
jgi:hypothetical protein